LSLVKFFFYQSH